jgi:hypothetical protein
MADITKNDSDKHWEVGSGSVAAEIDGLGSRGSEWSAFKPWPHHPQQKSATACLGVLEKGNVLAAGF